MVFSEAPADKAAATWEYHAHPPPPPPPPPPLNPWGECNWDACCTDGTPGCAVQIVTSPAFHGKESLSLEMAGSHIAGLSNRGLGHEGLVFQAGKDYEGTQARLQAKEHAQSRN